jgi:hypothetical protein
LILIPGNTARCTVAPHGSVLDDGATEKATHAPTKNWKRGIEGYDDK